MNTGSRSENNPPRPLRMWFSRVILTWTVPVLIVVLAIAYARYQIATRPKAQRQKPSQQARLVTIETAKKSSHKTVVSAMGPVIPAQQITLAPEVSGRVIFVNPLVIPGGAVRDYETIVKQRQSELAQAELNLKLEQGNQLVAQQEYKLLNDIIQKQDEELILRKPHLEETHAALEAAKAQLAKAQLDVERCIVKAPFNAVIQEKLVDVGAQVTASSSLLTIMGTDEYWVQAKIPVDELQWITIPDGDREKGSVVKIFDKAAWGPDIWREGRVLRLLGELEQQGRLAQVLVSVKDPLSLNSDSSNLPPILVGSYVRIEIGGITLEDVFSVKRDYLHDGENIWLMNNDDQMEVRPVEVLFRDKDIVYLSNGIQDGDRIVTTDISAPVDGMLLRLDHETTEKPETQE